MLVVDVKLLLTRYFKNIEIVAWIRKTALIAAMENKSMCLVIYETTDSPVIFPSSEQNFYLRERGGQFWTTYLKYMITTYS